MKICEKWKIYFLVHTFKKEKRTNNWISSTKSNAQIFYTVLNEGESDFADSTGCAQHYGKLYGMRHRKICAEKLSVELELHLKITEKLQHVVTNEELSIWELYNCKEAGLNFKFLSLIILIYNIHIQRNERRLLPDVNHQVTVNCEDNVPSEPNKILLKNREIGVTFKHLL